jgi:hypothetical protein
MRAEVLVPLHWTLAREHHSVWRTAQCRKVWDHDAGPFTSRSEFVGSLPAAFSTLAEGW